MFGLLADFDALVVAPCIPSAWKSYEVIKVFRGCRVHAQVENPNGVNQGVVKAILDGCSLPVADGEANIPTEMLAGRDKAELIVEMGKV